MTDFTMPAPAEIARFFDDITRSIDECVKRHPAIPDMVVVGALGQVVGDGIAAMPSDRRCCGLSTLLMNARAANPGLEPCQRVFLALMGGTATMQ